MLGGNTVFKRFSMRDTLVKVDYFFSFAENFVNLGLKPFVRETGSPKESSPLSFHLQNSHPRHQIETANNIQIMDHLKNYDPKPVWGDDSSSDPRNFYILGGMCEFCLG